MKTCLQWTLLCIVAASGCERLSAKNPEGPLKAAEVPSLATRGLLRDSYYQCARTSNGETWAIQNCIEREFEYQDGKLNSTYRTLRSRLIARARMRLRDEERKWLVDKDESCRWNENTEGQAQRIDANVCSLKKTAERASQLEHQLRALDKP